MPASLPKGASSFSVLLCLQICTLHLITSPNKKILNERMLKYLHSLQMHAYPSKDFQLNRAGAKLK